MALTINGTTGIETNTDTGKMKFGTGDDLEIYHDGSHSYVDNTGTGNLYLKDAGAVKIRTASFGADTADGSEAMIAATADGAVDLYHNGTKKFETTADGISVTGDIFGSGKLDLPDNGYLKLGTGDDLEIWHDGSNSYIKNSTNALTIQGAGVYINDVANGKTSASFDTDGAAELYYDNVKVLETHANGIFIRGPEGGDASVYFYSDEGDDDADKWRWRNDNNSTMLLEAKDSGSWYTHLQVSNSWTTIKSREANQGSSVVKIKKPDAAANVQSTVITFEIDDAGRGQIVASSSGSALPSFSTWSDRRLKTNFRSYTGGYDKIKAIPVKLYDEVSNDETKSVIGDNPATNIVGWIADEFQAVFPEAVIGEKDAVDSDGKPIYQTLSAGTVLPDVIQALQAAIEKIETLETKVAALEAA